MWWQFIPRLLISDISPFVCTVITVSGSFSLRENDEEEEEEEEEEEVGELSPHHLLLCGETSSSSPACCKARYGCGGIPWRHAPPSGCRGDTVDDKVGVASPPPMSTTWSVYKSRLTVSSGSTERSAAGGDACRSGPVTHTGDGLLLIIPSSSSSSSSSSSCFLLDIYLVCSTWLWPRLDAILLTAKCGGLSPFSPVRNTKIIRIIIQLSEFILIT